MRHLLITFLAFLLLGVAPASAGLTIGPLPSNAPQGFSNFFTKYVDVLGVGVYATKSCPDHLVLHTGGVLAQYLDNDEDGKADNPTVLARIIQLDGAMIMFNTWQEFNSSNFENQVPGSSLDYKQLHLAEETFPNGVAQKEFDITLEETLHLVTWAGYSKAFVSVFGEKKNTQIANAMEACKASGFYNPFANEPGMPYPDQVTEYHYWGLTSILGAQDYPWRISDIQSEWKLHNADLVKNNDPALHSLLTDPQWGFATVLPDGDYDPGSGCADPVPYGTGETGVGGLGTTSWTGGSPTVGNASFEITASGFNATSFGVLFTGTKVGSNVQPWGEILVGGSTTRTYFLTDAAGAASRKIDIQPAMVGRSRYYQYVVRAPVPGSTDNVQAGNGLAVTFCP